MPIRKFIFTVALASLLITLKAPAQLQQPGPDEDKAASAISLLWSPNEAEREQAKAEIIRLNEKAISGLLALLEDIFENPSKPRFANGREEEGKILWEQYLSLPRNVVGNIYEFEISGRLKNDIIEVLGDLRPNSAIPILVKIMKYRMKDNWIRQRTEPEMIALTKIGKPAVPALIKLIQDTEERTVSNMPGNPHISEEEMLIAIRSTSVTIQASSQTHRI